MQVLWHESGWDDYIWWQSQDKKTLKRINALIKDIQRNALRRHWQTGTIERKPDRLVEQTD